MQDKKLITAALSAVLAMGTAGSTAANAMDSKMEKCYGVAKAGMNSCGGNGHPCESHSTVDGHPGDWLLVPGGLCNKLVNGSSQPPKK